MKRFADLIDRLAFTTRAERKRALLLDYCRTVPDPDRGYALAALIGTLDTGRLRPALLRGLIGERCDAELFALSHDYVGDLAETVALMWPAPEGAAGTLSLADVVTTLQAIGRADLPGQLAAWLDRLPASERWALLKLATGSLAVGVTPALVRQTLAELGGVDVGEVEAVWHSQQPPYAALFAWLAAGAPQPSGPAVAAFRPLQPMQTIVTDDIAGVDPATHQVEWHWDGARAELSAAAGTVRLYDGAGDDITALFPDLIDGVTFDAVLDGVLLVMRNGVVAPVDDLQRRLARKRVSRDLLQDCPAHLRVFDLLAADGEDLRRLPLAERRRRLEDWYARHRPMGIDLAPCLDVADRAALAALHASEAPAGAAGLLLRRRDAAYGDGPWLHWPSPPRHIDCVLLYVERGHGGRAAALTDCTVGLWHDGDLVPVGKAALAADDAENVAAWARAHAVDRFGPVTQVEPGLVLDVAFDGVMRAARRKAGLVLREPRIAGICWDKPAAAAARIEALRALLPA